MDEQQSMEEISLYTSSSTVDYTPHDELAHRESQNLPASKYLISLTTTS